MMSSFLGGGFDAPRTPSMSRGDEESVDESKMRETTMISAGDSGGNDPHGDTSHADVTQDVSDIQRGGDDDGHDWDSEILNHVLVEILDKERVDAHATDDFTVFVITNGIDNVRYLMMMEEGDFHAMGHLIDFKTFQLLQTLNKMYNEVVTNEADKTMESLWFMGLKKRDIMRYMLRDKKVNTIPTDVSVTMPSVPLGRSNSNKAKLETARQLSLAMHNVGKPPLAPTPMASNTNRRVTFGPTTTATTAPMAPTTVTTAAAPVAVTDPLLRMWCREQANLIRADDALRVTTASYRTVSSGLSGIVL